MTQIYDLSDPAHPLKIRDFGLPGQQPGATGAVPTELHGPISTGPKGNRVYFGYGTNKGGILQIVDREKLLNGPKEPTPDNLRYPEISRLPMSAVQRRPHHVSDARHADRGIRRGQGRQDPRLRHDRRRGDPERMRRGAADGVVRRRHQRDAADDGLELDRAGGERAISAARRPLRLALLEREHDADLLQEDGLHRLLQCRACARSTSAIPIIRRKSPITFRRSPQATDKRCIPVEGGERCKIAIQTNNVEIDDRGYIYIVDRANTGMHILELTGPARAVAGLPKN